MKSCACRDDIRPGVMESTWRSALTLMLFDSFAVSSWGARVAVLTFMFLALLTTSTCERAEGGGSWWQPKMQAALVLSLVQAPPGAAGLLPFQALDVRPCSMPALSPAPQTPPTWPPL